MLFISPPFGNYINLDNAISIKGSFTLEPRYGLLSQIIYTLRYSFQHKGWTNQIGLRNNGIDYAINNYNTNNVYSIAILDNTEINKIKNKIPKDMNVEINVSCPNVIYHTKDKSNCISNEIKDFLNNQREWCIIKLPPVVEHSQIDTFYNLGFRQFHCSNTLKTKDGGLSGPILKPYTSNLIKYIKQKYPDSEVIAGGGIKTIDDIKHYKALGADHFSVSTLCFNPLQLYILYNQYIMEIM